MKNKHILVAIVIIISVFSSLTAPMFNSMSSVAADLSDALGKNEEAMLAFAVALENGLIEYNDEWTNYDIADFDGDGIKDLFLSTGTFAKIYSYKDERISQLLKRFEVSSRLTYDSKKKIFWMTGDGDGGWCIAYKYKNKKLKEKYEYGCGVYGKPKFFFEKKGHKAKKISKKKYIAANRYASKWYKKVSRSQLVTILKKLGGSDNSESAINPSLPQVSEKIIFRTNPEDVEEFSIIDNYFYIKLKEYNWGYSFFSAAPIDDFLFFNPNQTMINQFRLELAEKPIYTISRFNEYGDEIQEKISYQQYETLIDEYLEYDEEYYLDIYVKDEKIVRLGLFEIRSE